MVCREAVMTICLCATCAPVLCLAGEAGGPVEYRALGQFGGDFTLIDSRGQPFELRDSRGKVVVIYFGFTSCADTCPATLSTLAAVMRSLGPQADRVQPLFITVDPERDTPEVLRDFVPYFHPAIIALTGTQEAVEQVAAQYRAPVYLRKRNESGYYVVDHSSYLYVVAPDGQLANLIRHGDPVDRIAEVVRGLLQQADLSAAGGAEARGGNG